MEKFFQYISPSHQTILKKLLLEENENRKQLEMDILIFPEEETKSVKSNLFDANQWTVGALASLLREAGVRTRKAGRELTGNPLMTRMRQVYENTASASCYEPTVSGANWWEYWLPFFIEFIYLIIFVSGTILGVLFLYTWTENLHASYGCISYTRFYSWECFILKKARAYLENLNYDLAHTVIMGVALSLTRILAKFQAVFNRKVLL